MFHSKYYKNHQIRTVPSIEQLNDEAQQKAEFFLTRKITVTVLAFNLIHISLMRKSCRWRHNMHSRIHHDVHICIYLSEWCIGDLTYASRISRQPNQPHMVLSSAATRCFVSVPTHTHMSSVRCSRIFVFIWRHQQINGRKFDGIAHNRMLHVNARTMTTEFWASHRFSLFALVLWERNCQQQ